MNNAGQTEATFWRTWLQQKRALKPSLSLTTFPLRVTSSVL
jgi:hypothetical protein